MRISLILSALMLLPMTAPAHEAPPEIPSFVHTWTKVLGRGSVYYSDGVPTSTSRSLLHFRNENDVAKVSRDLNPVHRPFPSTARSRVVFRYAGGVNARVSIEEIWDESGKITEEYKGARGTRFKHDLEFKFVKGSWETFTAGGEVVMMTTSQSAVVAAGEMADAVAREAKRHLGRAGQLLLARKHPEVLQCVEALTGEYRAQRKLPKVIDELLDVIYPPKHHRESTVVTHTPHLAIEISGTKSSFAVKYLNDMYVQVEARFY